MKRYLALLLFIGCVGDQNEPQSADLLFEKAQTVASKMKRGINIGNTLEPPEVGDWNNDFVSEYFFDDYLLAGFNTVRVPIRWDKHTLIDPPYTISGTWLDTVQQVVDWGLSKDLFIIINSHHDWWFSQLL